LESKFGSGVSWSTWRRSSLLDWLLLASALFALKNVDQRLDARPIFEAMGVAIARVVG